MPRSLNRCTFIGRVAAKPVKGQMPDGAATSRFIISVPDSDERSTLIPVVAYGKVAGVCNLLLRPDVEVYVEGKWKSQRKSIDGTEVIVTELLLENMQTMDQSTN